MSITYWNNMCIYIFWGVQFFPTAEESIAFYNQKRCVDGKGLILPSQVVSVSALDKAQY